MAERARAAALVARDPATLALRLHEELIHIHATGVKHDRAGLVSAVWLRDPGAAHGWRLVLFQSTRLGT